MSSCMNSIVGAKMPESPNEVDHPSQQLRQLRERLSAANAELRRETKVVGEIQRSLLPEVLPVIDGFDVASFYRPCALAGGDYYDIVPLVDGHWGLIMADVAGHGTSSAVIMAVMRTLVHAHLPQTRFLPSCEFLDFMNRQMSGVYTRGGRFVTVWCAVLEPATRRLTYASAGHNPPRLLRGSSIIALDAVGGLPLGIEERSRYEEAGVTLEPNDLLVIYTDGVTEAIRDVCGHREYFATDRLDQVIIESRRDGASGCICRITEAVTEFTRADVPMDDQTLLVFRATGL